jgi:hypothetical protein
MHLFHHAGGLLLLQETFLWWAWIFPAKEVHVMKQIWITFVVTTDQI